MLLTGRTLRCAGLVLAVVCHGCGSSDPASDHEREDGGAGAGSGGSAGAALSTDGGAGKGGAQERCDTALDDDGDGEANEGCACPENGTRTCYVGAASLAGVGACSLGTQACIRNSEQGEFDTYSWGPCTGAGMPAPEVCDNGIDEDCSGDDQSCFEELALCDSKPRQVLELDIVFPKTSGHCVWDHGQKSGTMAGHRFEKKPIPIPDGYVPCAMELTSPQTTMYYDDFLLVHFDDRALIGSTGMIDLLLEDPEGLPLFEWSRLLFKKPVGPTTCLDGATVCTMPGTQKNGPFALKLDVATNMKLMKVALAEKKYELNVVTTGDNNPDIDCAHSELPLHVKIEYYVK